MPAGKPLNTLPLLAELTDELIAETARAAGEPAWLVERGAGVTFMQGYTSRDMAEQALAVPATEIFVGEGATLRFVMAQSWGQGVYHIGAQRLRVGRDASVDLVGANLGGKLQHLEA